MASGEERSTGDERRKRQEALRALAEGAPASLPPDASAPPASPASPDSQASPLRPTPRRWLRWALPLLSALALLAVVAALVAHFLPASAPTKTRVLPSELALDPTSYGMECLANAAWSPDSATVAILGQQQQCGIPQPEIYANFPTLVVFVDAVTGRKLGQLSSDATIQRDLHLPAPQYITPMNGPHGSGDLTQQGVFYTHMTWSPDSRQIALLFSATIATKPFTGQPVTDGMETVQGVYIAGVNGAGAHAFAVTQAGPPQYINEWNVKTGKPVPPPSPQSGSPSQFIPSQLMPPALTYSWGADGSLTGTGALNPTNTSVPPPLGPVGNPDGGASFTVWQPLSISQYSSDSAPPKAVPVFTAASDFSAWSPSGTYLLSAYAAWRLQSDKQPAPSAGQLKAEQLTHMPLLPVRDAAMDAVLGQAALDSSGVTDTLAWRPDGKRMAALTGDANETATLTVLDCASGATLASMQLSRASNADGNIQTGSGIMWAPDGTRLLVGVGPELYILEPGKLPK